MSRLNRVVMVASFRKFIFLLLVWDNQQWVEQYRKFVSFASEEEIYGVMERKRSPSVLGPASFIDWFKSKCFGAKTDQDVLQANELAPAPDFIIAAVCEFGHVCEKDLYRYSRGAFNEPWNVALFLIRKRRRDRLKMIRRQFGMEKYRSLDSIIERIKQRMLKERSLKKRIGRIAKKILKSREQT